MSQSTPPAFILWALKLFLVVLTAALSRRPEDIKRGAKKRIQIIVLGDIGRSPRMQYHALSVAANGGLVDLIGYLDSDLHPEISKREAVCVYPLAAFPAFLNTRNRKLFTFLGPLKAFFQVWALWNVLYLEVPRSEWMLTQNPPSIPTLAVTIIVCRLRSTRLVIDWHNFGFSILSLKLGRRHPLVMISKLYESVCGRLAYAHICVTDAMARALKADFGIAEKTFTLPDRPAPIFKPLSSEAKSVFLYRLSSSLSKPDDQHIPVQLHSLSVGSASGMCSHMEAAQQALQAVKDESSRLIISSTSWTPDEDFSILLDALTGYSFTIQNRDKAELPKVVLIVTGKGPGRSAFETKVQSLFCEGRLSCVSVLTAYFNNVEDYAKLLACADLGVSLHTSSSGVDLPMKVLDMFGAGLPVAGWSDFEAWPELVQEGQNGMGFRSAVELQRILEKVFGTDDKLLSVLQKGALGEGRRRWDDEWRPVCGKLFKLTDFA